MSATPFAHVIDATRVLELYALGIQLGEKGLAGPPKSGCVDGALGNAWTAELYRQDEDAEQAGLLFAVYLFVYLARGHCFVDGNKRVAWLALLEVLLHYNVEADCETDEVVAICNALLEPESKMGADNVIDWLLPKLKRVVI